MEPEGSSPCSQEASTSPYPEPDQSNSHHPILSLYHFTSNIPGTKPHVHFLSLGSFIQGISPGPRLLVVFRNKLIFYGERLLAPRPTPKLGTTPCRLSATAYSTYSQLPSKTGGNLLHPQPEDAPCRGDKGPT
jgi:hypothetical protein